MRSVNRQFSLFGVFILTGMMVLSGCASRKYVRNTITPEVAKLDTRINETNTKVTEAGERIDAVDRRAQQGIQAADSKATQAGTAAAAADSKATNAQRTADTANTGVQTANTRITAVESRFNSIDTYTAAGPATTVTFKNGSAVLSDDAKKSLDGVASQVSNLTNGYAVEIQGFTDNRGSESFNFGLSERRAEAVKRYLVSKNVQLLRISIVGLGEDNPVAENKTAKGREQNRRVDVRILRSAQGRTGANN